MTSIKELELSARDIMLYAFLGVPKVGSKPQYRLEYDYSSKPRFTHERDNIAKLGKYFVYYKGRTIAKIQVKPHRVMTVYEQFDSFRIPAKVLERVVKQYVPSVKIEVFYGEP